MGFSALMGNGAMEVLTNETADQQYATHRSRGHESVFNEFICAVDAHNGEIVLRIGTDYSDGYYPRCILEYNPENMHINEMRGGTL